jgi:hypothetical protein
MTIVGSGITVGNGIVIGAGTAAAPSIVSTGLVLNLDAGDVSSYPGSGSTWTDISGSGLTGTLSANVSYSSANGGAMSFTGVSSVVTVASASSVTGLTNNISIEAWYQSTNNRPKILTTGPGSIGLDFGQFSINPTNWKVTKYGLIDLYLGSIPQDTNWHQVVVTYSSTAGVKVYVDGAVSGSSASTVALKAGAASIPIGQAEGGYHTGKISIVRWYNAVLSSTDVTQNFNAIKSRYGL